MILKKFFLHIFSAGVDLSSLDTGEPTSDTSLTEVYTAMAAAAESNALEPPPPYTEHTEEDQAAAEEEGML